MDLVLVETFREKRDAQAELKHRLMAAWGNRQRRRIVWRPSSRVLRIAHNDQFWFSSAVPRRSGSKVRYWNAFGRYAESGGLQIAVEINISSLQFDRTVAGFFARDVVSGNIVLMHDGGIGGGYPGIGRNDFLAWSGERIWPVIDSRGEMRFGILVGTVASSRIAYSISRFARRVIEFKQHVKTGHLVPPNVIETYNDYRREFSGTKKGKRAAEFEYLSRHGDIVEALRQWREGSSSLPGRIVKNAYVDLGVKFKHSLAEIYEVKTNSSRQTLYTAIGQLLVHGGDNPNVRRVLVLPIGGEIPRDVNKLLQRLKIEVLRFALTNTAVSIQTN